MVRLRTRVPGARRVLATALLALPCALAAQDDMDDVLGGFDDLSTPDSIELPPTQAQSAGRDPRWSVDGALALTLGYNLRDHRSSTGTDYGGMSKLRLRASLGVERSLGENWQLEINASLAEDAIYRLRDESYTREVLDEMRTDPQLQDSFVRGRLGGGWDLKLGRQVAVWGFADSLRVLDVLNPLDNREPGLADIEDLRLPRGMLRLDHFRGPWQLGLMVLPEHRFSRNPPFGSDFYALNDSQGRAVRVREERPEHWRELSWAGALTGRFSGWDLSVNAARLWRDEPYLDGRGFQPSSADDGEAEFFAATVLRHSRINLFGQGLQFTRGSWLIKQEAALLSDVDLTSAPVFQPPGGPLDGVPIVGEIGPGDTAEETRIPNGVSRHSLYRVLVGLEYYGLADTTFSLEVSAQQISDFDADLAAAGQTRRQNDTALRISREFLNARLRVTAISVLFDRDLRFGGADGGAIHRLGASYELGPGLSLDGTVIAYQSGKRNGFASVGDNDRLNIELRWAF